MKAELSGLALVALLLAPPALAQRSERFGPYELHYNVVNTTFLAPGVASAYGITRGDRRALLNLAVREHSGGDPEAPAVGRPMQLKGRSWDLLQREEQLDFREIREGQAVYYIAEFEFLNEEWRHFELHFRPEGAEQTYSFRFRHKMYEN